MKYSELVVWQKAMDLVTAVYKTTTSFPADERFGLTSQVNVPLFLFLPTLPKGKAENQPGLISIIFPSHMDR